MVEEIKYLPSFQQELDAIVDYISLTLEAPRSALNLVDELEISVTVKTTQGRGYQSYW